MLLEVFAACSAGMRRDTEWVVYWNIIKIELNRGS
jgi:hypothetical protein